MRDILFRGKRKDCNIFEIGNFSTYTHSDGISRSYINGFEYEVYPETVGQYTGLTDKNGKKIFEGDIVEVFYDVRYVGVAAERIGNFEVVFDNGCFMKKKIDGVGLFHFIGSDVCTIIGNVHDNPELLKGSAE